MQRTATDLTQRYRNEFGGLEENYNLGRNGYMSSSCEVTNGLLYDKNSRFTAHMDPKETCPLDIKVFL
jgi:hypothetical protein